jgi:hypothetical protein
MFTGFSFYDSIVFHIMSHADDFIQFRRKIETYIKSLATSKSPRRNEQTMTRTSVSSSPTFLSLLRRHREQAAFGWCGCPKMNNRRCIFFEHQKLSQIRTRRPRGNKCVRISSQASSGFVDAGLDRALPAVTQGASSRRPTRKNLATVLKKSNTWAEGAPPREHSYPDFDQNHDIPKEPYTTIKVSSLLCTKATTQ